MYDNGCLYPGNKKVNSQNFLSLAFGLYNNILMNQNLLIMEMYCKKEPRKFIASGADVI